MHTSAAQEDHGDERPGGVKAVGAAGDGPDLAVESFGGPVRQARADVLEDSLQVLLDGEGDAFEVLKAAVTRFRDPELEPATSDVDLTPVEDGRQGLLEHVGSEEWLVRLFELRQRLGLDIRQVPRALLQGPPGPLESGLRIRAVRLADLVAACLVECVLGESLDVEAVEDQLGLGARLGHRLDVGPREIDRHGLEQGAAFGAKIIEETLQCRGALAFCSPDDAAALVIDHDGDVLVVPAVAELVHADQPQAVEAVSVRSARALDDSPDQRADGAPGRAQQGDDGGLAALLGEEGGSLFECVGEVAAVRRPGDALGLDCPTVGAVSTLDAVAQVQRHASQVVVSPAPLASIVDRAALGTTFPAAGDRPGRDHVHDQTRGAEVEVANREVVDAEKDSEYRGRAQGGAWAEDVDTRSLVSSPRASTSRARTLENGFQVQVSERISVTRLPLMVQESQK